MPSIQETLQCVRQLELTLCLCTGSDDLFQRIVEMGHIGQIVDAHQREVACWPVGFLNQSDNPVFLQFDDAELARILYGLDSDQRLRGTEHRFQVGFENRIAEDDETGPLRTVSPCLQDGVSKPQSIALFDECSLEIVVALDVVLHHVARGTQRPWPTPLRPNSQAGRGCVRQWVCPQHAGEPLEWCGYGDAIASLAPRQG